MTREEITQILQDKDKTFICDVIIRLIESGNIDITDFNTCYINTLQKRLNKKDRIIKEADNCIFNSLFYDSIGVYIVSCNTPFRYDVYSKTLIKKWNKEEKK